jgi:hypothetical protein
MYIGNTPFQGLVGGGNILDASIEGVDLSTSAIAARLGYTPVDPGAAVFSATVGISSGNLNFSSTGQKITADFSNGTVANRAAFQTTTANSATRLTVLPSGTGTISAINLHGASDPTNSSVAQFNMVDGTSAQVQSNRFGTGTYYPLTFHTSNTEQVRIDTSGNFKLNGGYMSFGDNGYIRADSEGWLQLQSGTSGTRIMNSSNAAAYVTIDSSGNFLLGVTDTNPPTSANAFAFAKSDNTLRFSNTTAAGKVWTIGTATPGIASQSDFFSFGRYNGTAWAELARFDNAGRLMIGVTSNINATTALQVYWSNNARIGIDSPDSQGFYFTKAGANNGTFRVDTNGNYEWYTKTVSQAMILAAGGDLLINATANYTGAKLYVENKINVNYSGEIAMRYNNSSSTENTGYWKGMTGTSPASGGSARGLHLFNYDKDSDEGINFWTGIPGSATRLARILPSGNVGIGTDSPAVKLHVTGNGEVLRVATTTNGYLSWYRGATWAGYIDAESGGDMTYANATSTGNIKFITNSGERMRITAGGSVGIGETSPANRLSVTSTGSSNTGVIGITATDSSSSFIWASQAFDSVMPAGSTFLHMIGKSGSTRNAGYIGYRWNSDAASGNLLTFGHFGVDYAMNLTGAGNVGIGTTTPQGTLELKGNYEAGYSLVLSGTYGTGRSWGFRTHGGNSETFALYDITGTLRRMYFSSTGETVFENGSGVQRLFIDANGQVGIATAPGYKFHVEDSSALSSGFRNHSSFTMSNMTGGGLSVGIGKSGSTNNLAKVVFNYAGSGSTSNSLGLGFWDNDNKWKLFPTGRLDINGVSVFYTAGNCGGVDSFYVDIPIANDNTGSANTYHIQASFSHASWGGYGCLLDTWYNARGAGNFIEQYDTRAVTSSNGGSWSVSKPAAGTLRITKNAGTYSGGGPYWIRVTFAA